MIHHAHSLYNALSFTAISCWIVGEPNYGGGGDGVKGGLHVALLQ